MRYPILNRVDARLALQRYADGVNPEIGSLTRYAGEGASMDLSFLRALEVELESLRERFPAVGSGGMASRFEAEAAVAAHRSIPDVPEAHADPGFWAWLTLGHFVQLVRWRYQVPAGVGNSTNYGVGSPGENFMFRLWLRGAMAVDQAAADPYDLVRRGQTDFWRSHLFRQGYANSRDFTRGFIQFQYPDPVRPDAPRLEIAQIRELVKRLRRARMNLVVEALDEIESRQAIEHEFRALSAA